MTLNLKIEILKIFSLEFNFSSEKEIKFKKDKPNEEDSSTVPATSKPASTSK